jgi:catechol 2,3-dioxygenase-like lactoylglutathione lyase family enzyme
MRAQLDPDPDPDPVPGWRDFGIGIGIGNDSNPIAHRSAVVLSVLILLATVGVGFASDPVMPEGFQEVVFSVSDLDQATTFYLEVAGWEVAGRNEAAVELAGFWGLDPATSIHEVLLKNPGADHGFLRLVSFPGADGSNAGSVELIAFDGATGADFSKRAEAPNLGILALRFPVADLEAYRKRLADRGVVPINGPSTMRIEPYGEVEIMTIRAPEGAWLEFYEPRMSNSGRESPILGVKPVDAPVTGAKED